MRSLPKVTFDNFPEILFNSSVAFDNGEETALDWQGASGVYTAAPTGVGNLKL